MFDIITIGTATRDVFLTSPFFWILRDPKHLKKIGFAAGKAQCFPLAEKIEVDKPVFATGGGATNTAVTFSRQGLKTAGLIKIGRDESADFILKEFEKEKITPLAVRSKDKTTAYSTILLTPEGERTILVHRGASEDLKIKEIPFKKLETRWAYISGEIPFLTAEKTFNHFFKNQVFIAFNPSRYFLDLGIKKLKPSLNKSQVVILNREEAAYLTKIDYSKEREIFKKLDEIVDGIVVMTDGNKGVLVSDGKNIYQAGIFSAKSGKEKVIDRTGAGDAFGSGFVAGLMKYQVSSVKCQVSGVKYQIFSEQQIKYAIRLGSANATSVIRKIGAKAGILTKKEFEENKRWRNLKIGIIRI